jgi:hypothetical protein
LNENSPSNSDDEELRFYQAISNYFAQSSDYMPSEGDNYFYYTGPCTASDPYCPFVKEQKIKENAINAFLDLKSNGPDGKRRKRNIKNASCNSGDSDKFLFCQGPCINELPSPNCSPVKKRIRLQGSGSGCNDDDKENKENKEDDCKQTGGNGQNNAGSKVALKSKENTIEDTKECYFAQERLNPEGKEQKE